MKKTITLIALLGISAACGGSPVRKDDKTTALESLGATQEGPESSHRGFIVCEVMPSYESREAYIKLGEEKATAGLGAPSTDVISVSVRLTICTRARLR